MSGPIRRDRVQELKQAQQDHPPRRRYGPGEPSPYHASALPLPRSASEFEGLLRQCKTAGELAALDPMLQAWIKRRHRHHERRTASHGGKPLPVFSRDEEAILLKLMAGIKAARAMNPSEPIDQEFWTSIERESSSV
jgi:hypothetical protein